MYEVEAILDKKYDKNASKALLIFRKRDVPGEMGRLQQKSINLVA